MLSIQEFITNKNYDINDIYIDKFWSSIADDKWIYIDDNTLNWIGYSSNSDLDKKKFLKLLNFNFNENTDFKHLNTSEFKTFYCTLKGTIENCNINTHNKVKHLILSPECFKQSLMLMRTEKAKNIRIYYVQIEKIFKDYLKYQNDYTLNKLKNTETKLEQAKSALNLNIAMKANTIQKLEKTDFVYIATNQINSRGNIYKIGKTKDLKKRICNFNINASNENLYYYSFVFHTHSSETIEAVLLKLLKPFQYKNELFQLHYSLLHKIVLNICLYYDKSVNLVNSIIDNEYTNSLNEKPVIPKELIISNIELNLHFKTHYNYDLNNEIDIGKKNNDDEICDDEETNNDETNNDETNNILSNIKNLDNIKHASTNESNIVHLDSKTNKFKPVDNSLQKIKTVNGKDYDTTNEKDKAEYIKLLDDNVYTYNGVKLYICPVCKIFCTKTKTCVTTHLNRQVPCTQNNNITEYTLEYIESLIKLNNITFYQCDTCDKIFINKTKLDRHKENENGCNKFECNICNKKFLLEDNYNAHIQTCQNNIEQQSTRIDKYNSYKNEDGTYTCSKCNIILSTRSQFDYHFKYKTNCNQIEKKYKCLKCKRSFSTEDSLNEHNTKYKNCENLIFVCELCDNKVYAHRKSYMNHYNKYHK